MKYLKRFENIDIDPFEDEDWDEEEYPYHNDNIIDINDIKKYENKNSKYFFDIPINQKPEFYNPLIELFPKSSIIKYFQYHKNKKSEEIDSPEKYFLLGSYNGRIGWMPDINGYEFYKKNGFNYIGLYNPEHVQLHEQFQFNDEDWDEEEFRNEWKIVDFNINGTKDQFYILQETIDDYTCILYKNIHYTYKDVNKKPLNQIYKEVTAKDLNKIFNNKLSIKIYDDYFYKDVYFKNLPEYVKQKLRY